MTLTSNADPEPVPTREPSPEVPLVKHDPTFRVIDMHGNGTEPAKSVKVMDGSLAERGYWLSSAFLGMPKKDIEARIGAGVLLEKADLPGRERMLRQRLEASGIAGTRAMVMLDAEAFSPFESERALAWYNMAAHVACEHFEQWFWYFQPERVESAVPSVFASEEAYFDWYASQDFMKLASAVSVVLYHGRDRDAGSPVSAASRTRNDRHLRRGIEFARRLGKPLIVVVRADMSGRPREQIMTQEALEASWRELFLREGVDGVAIWNDQPQDMIDFDRRWSQSRIEPTVRKLLDERAQHKPGKPEDR
ncbi:MAG: hypothetical protein KJZ65_06110 [Phycisphaerales bacterium]|nr:hypothetical protein [Phycisphaerales bacterium]